MNRSVAEADGGVLVVSQFTRHVDAGEGRRPSFVEAARPEVDLPLCEGFVTLLRETGRTVAIGELEAAAGVNLLNDGPGNADLGTVATVVIGWSIEWKPRGTVAGACGRCHALVASGRMSRPAAVFIVHFGHW